MAHKINKRWNEGETVVHYFIHIGKSFARNLGVNMVYLHFAYRLHPLCLHPFCLPPFCLYPICLLTILPITHFAYYPFRLLLQYLIWGMGLNWTSDLRGDRRTILSAVPLWHYPGPCSTLTMEGHILLEISQSTMT
jgi:hypothetical protein